MEGRAKGRDRKDWKEDGELEVTYNKKKKLHWGGGKLVVNMINSNMDGTAYFAGHLPLDPFSPLYHIAVVLIRCVRSVCVCMYCI